MDREPETEDFSAKARRLLTVCKKALRHTLDKIDKQDLELLEARRFLTYQQWADTLVSRPDGDGKGVNECVIENIHSGIVERIGLNPKLTARQNAQLYYKKSKKGKHSLVIIEEKMADSMAVRQKLEILIKEFETVLQTSPSEHDAAAALDALSLQLSGLGFTLPETASQRPRATDSTGAAYREYRFDGWSVFIGKNDSQNDELTTRFARPQDIWMHAAGCSGSHVIIRREKNAPWPPQEILRKAASLAVWFSKAKHTSSCEVHYTEARYVHKRRKSPPGEVVMQQYKSMRAAPVSPQVYFPGEYKK